MEKDFIQSLKEFFFDIIGYFVPGFVISFLIAIILDYNIDFEKNKIQIIILCYVIGYLVYAITLVKDILSTHKLGKHFFSKNRNDAENDLSAGETFLLAKELFNKKSNNENHINEFRPLRNIAMSLTPEADKKIYTFMFRAELFNQTHTISIIVLILIIAKGITSYFLSSSFQINEFGWILIPILIVSILTLRKGWYRFYKIAMSLPFSMYITNQIHKNE